MRLRFLLLGLMAGLAAGASAAEPAIPEGMVDNPCIGLPVAIPQSIVDYVNAMYDPRRTTPVTPPPQADRDLLAARKAEQVKRDWPDLCRYRADNMRLMAEPADARRIVFMGDSITEGWKRAHPGFWDSTGRIDRGISGQTSPQMLLRFQADVVALKPKLVHIMAGTNDLAGNTGANSPQEYKNNIMAMVALAKAAGIGVILAGIPPAMAFPWKPAIKPAPRVRELNAWLEDYAHREGLTFVDYGAVLAAADGSLKKEYTFDGIHPSEPGYTAMEPLALDAIRRAGVR